MIKSVWLSAAAVALMAATPVLAQQAPTVADLSKAPRMGPWGFALEGRDPAVPPTQSLYLSANGHYLTALQIPADRSRYGAFDTLNELSQARMRAVTEKAAADHAATGPSALVGALYRGYLDEARVNALGARPLAPALAGIRAAKTRDDIARLMGRSMKDYGGAFFSLSIFDDAKAPLRYAVYVGQAGLGLPDRDYYLDARFAAQKTAYQAYVAKMLTLAGWPEPAAAAKSIVELETEIAKVSWTAAERRDDDKTYNPYDVDKLAAYAPGFNWPAFLQGADLSGRGRVVAQENTALPKIAALYAQAPVATLKAWMAFHVADNAAPYLSTDFDKAHFEFRQKTLSGQPQQQPRWRRGVVLLDSQIGEALGQLYVAAYFPPQDKAQMQAMVSDILAAMKVRLQNVDWMSPQTKAKALEKLASFNVKLAYPDHWRDYSGLQLTNDDLYGDVERASAFEWARHVARLNKPVDRTEWEMTPSTINAYYSPTRNEIVFPAAILQPPFFDPDGDPAINYGAIGGVIGHEITHGFDDQGRKYTGDGSLRDWWTPADVAKFQVQATRLGKQYSAIEVLPGAHIDGDRTMGENIADLGGVLLALDAYHLSLKGRPAPVIDGLTGDQRVFLGWAQVWRCKSRDDRTRQDLVSDPHSPWRYRVDVPARNVDAFYAAFGVKPGDVMYVAPADRVKIW